MVFSFINVFGFTLLPLMFIATSWLDFANYALPVRVVHGGVLISLAGLWLMWQSHIDLGEHWSPVAEIQPNHTLVTTSMYRFIRHPIYASIFLGAIGQFMLIRNWIVGPSALIGFFLLYQARVANEEHILIAEFGEAYLAYSNKTGLVFPRFF
jgi:protein-S-isoprenylcysteine O-methyltransferase Ste14